MPSFWLEKTTAGRARWTPATRPAPGEPPRVARSATPVSSQCVEDRGVLPLQQADRADLGADRDGHVQVLAEDLPRPRLVPGVRRRETLDTATASTVPCQSWAARRTAATSSGAISRPSKWCPPPITRASARAASRRSAGQSASGGTAVVAGAPMRSTPTRRRPRRSTMALVHWVVPSIACWTAARSCPSSTASSASRTPDSMSDVVGRLTAARTVLSWASSTASVLVPPTSIPMRSVIARPPGGWGPCRSRRPGVPRGAGPRAATRPATTGCPRRAPGARTASPRW